MATGSLSRGLAIIQCLIGETDGVPLARIAEEVDLPKSAAHRILTVLVNEGFVDKPGPSGNYALTLRLVGLGLRHLASSTVTELAMPVLTRLASESGQLVRLGLLDGDQLVWVARAQGARAGLRYDPDVDHGSRIPFATSASGLAWLSHLDDDAALRFVARQEPEERHPVGRGAPHSLADVVDRIRIARERGWSSVHDSVEEGISAMAAPLIDPDTDIAHGVVSVAGPSLQLTDARMVELAPPLKAAAADLAGLAASLAGEARSRRGVHAPA